jgi:hypothetical protein
MAVECAPGDIRLHADLLYAGVFDTLGLEQVVGSILDAAADLLFALLASPNGCLDCVHEESVIWLQSESY